MAHFSSIPSTPTWLTKADWNKERTQGSCKYHLPLNQGDKRARGTLCDGTKANCPWREIFSKVAKVPESTPPPATSRVIPPEVGQSARSANAGKDWFGG